MKFIGHVHDQTALQETVGLLHSRGIPTFTKYSGAPGFWPRPFRAAIFVSLDHHYGDALALLKDSTHKVADPVDAERYIQEVQNKPISLRFVFGWLVALGAVAVFFVFAAELAGIEWRLGT